MADPLGLINAAGGAGMPQVPKAPVGPAEGQGASFKDVLMENINQVNRLQQDAETAISDLTSGRRDDVASVLMAKQKADLAFQMLQQVRNKLVDAYEEVKQMRV
jgi:flagellar hook-basal body complex protein FliE